MDVNLKFQISLSFIMIFLEIFLQNYRIIFARVYLSLILLNKNYVYLINNLLLIYYIIKLFNHSYEIIFDIDLYLKFFEKYYLIILIY